MHAQSCLTLCDPVDCSPPGSTVHGIFQARSGLPFPSPTDLPDPGIEPASPESPALAGRFSITEPPWKPHLDGASAETGIQDTYLPKFMPLPTPHFPAALSMLSQ